MAEPLPLYVTQAETMTNRIEELATRAPETAWATLIQVMAVIQETFDRMRVAYPVAFGNMVLASFQPLMEERPELQETLITLQDDMMHLSTQDDAATMQHFLETLNQLNHAVRG